MQFSVLMAVYQKDHAEHLESALESIARQTLPADEVVLVEDGPIGSDLRSVIDRYAEVLPLVTLALPENKGLGFALNAGLSRCTHAVVARMDADDICVPHRFETQIQFLALHSGVAVLGSAIAEFVDESSKVQALRVLPSSGEELRSFANLRNPLNHMTVVFRKAAVQEVGGYQTAHGFEDYHLWARVLVHGYQLHNLDQPLVLVRCGNGMQSRRGGLTYAMREAKFQFFLRKVGLISTSRLGCNLLMRTPMRIFPERVRALLYQRLLRRPG